MLPTERGEDATQIDDAGTLLEDTTIVHAIDVTLALLEYTTITHTVNLTAALLVARFAVDMGFVLSVYTGDSQLLVRSMDTLVAAALVTLTRVGLAPTHLVDTFFGVALGAGLWRVHVSLHMQTMGFVEDAGLLGFDGLLQVGL